jgi:very-short-patch-repair endonuclease
VTLGHNETPRGNRRNARAMRRAMTPAELRLWLRLQRRQLGGLRFRRQAPLGPYIVDFFCPERKLVIELDGDQHGRDENVARDAQRTQWLEQGGLRVIRFSNADVMRSLDGVYDAIVEATSRLPLPKTPSAF